jgi:hypothetical protein
LVSVPEVAQGSQISLGRHVKFRKQANALILFGLLAKGRISIGKRRSVREELKYQARWWKRGLARWGNLGIAPGLQIILPKHDGEMLL